MGGGTNAAEVYNNIFMGNTEGGGDPYRMQIFVRPGCSITACDYNMFWGDGTPGENICRYDVTDYNFAGWQGFGFDANGYWDDPEFIITGIESKEKLFLSTDDITKIIGLKSNPSN